MGNSSVSIIIPTYQKRELLSVTLEALAHQTYPADRIEVIVADDASEDGTAELLESAEAPFTLVPVRHETNKGRAAARNSALSAAGGELVLFVDDDMRTEPGLVRAHVDGHEAHPWSAVIGNTRTAPELDPSNVYSYLDSRGVHKRPPNHRMPARYFLTNNASVPREALLRAGFFDEGFRGYGFEDMEIAYRLERAAGLSFWYAGDAIAYHIHTHTLDQLIEKRFESARSTLRYIIDKHPEASRDLSVEVLLPASPLDQPSLRLKKSAVSFLMAGPFRALAERLARIDRLGPVAYPAFDYLIANAYYRGLRSDPAP